MLPTVTPMDRVIAEDLEQCVKDGFPSCLDDTTYFDVLLTYAEELKPHLISGTFADALRSNVKSFVTRIASDRWDLTWKKNIDMESLLKFLFRGCTTLSL